MLGMVATGILTRAMSYFPVNGEDVPLRCMGLRWQW